jgi:uncharacterized protein (DUF885 family)
MVDCILDKFYTDYLNSNPFNSTQIVNSHLDTATIPYTLIDKNDYILNNLLYFRSCDITNCNTINTVIEILIEDKKICLSPIKYLLIYFNKANPFNDLITLVKTNKQPIKTEQDINILIKRIYSIIDVIDIIKNKLLQGARIGYKCSKISVSRLINQLQHNYNFNICSIYSINTLFKSHINLYIDWLSNIYIHLCSNNIGLYKLPHYDDIYKLCIKRYTGLDLTSDEIITIGYNAVDLLYNELKTIIYSIDNSISVKDFELKYMKCNTNYFTSEQEFINYSTELLHTFDKYVTRNFELPNNYKIPIINIVNVDQDMIAWCEESDIYNNIPPIFFLNIFYWNKILKSDLVSVILHEGIPGHAFQFQFNNTNKCLKIVKFFDNVIEGIGLFSESLFNFNDFRIKYSCTMFKLWRALRLIIDASIHTKGWSESQSVVFMSKYCYHDNTIIKNEIVRYSMNPGKACSYYIGYMELQNMLIKWSRKFYPSIKCDNILERVKIIFFNNILKYSRYSMNDIKLLMNI